MIAAVCILAAAAVMSAVFFPRKPKYIDPSTVFVTGETVNKEPVVIEPRVCKIVHLEAPENPEPAPLYAYYVFPSEKDAERIRDAWDFATPSKGIYVEDNGFGPKAMYKFPFIPNDRITSMITVHLNKNGTNTHDFTHDGDFFNALAALTSPEEPLYVFYDKVRTQFNKIGYIPYYIIGDTAYTDREVNTYPDGYLRTMTVDEDKEFAVVKFDCGSQK